MFFNDSESNQCNIFCRYGGCRFRLGGGLGAIVSPFPPTLGDLLDLESFVRNGVGLGSLLNKKS